MKSILADIQYFPGYEFETISLKDNEFEYIHLLRVVMFAKCTVSGEEDLQRGRWLVVEDPTDEAEVVRTAYQALGMFQQHEFQENFKYKGKVVFDPHAMNL